jgi:SAM-dependent methyltransferase
LNTKVLESAVPALYRERFPEASSGRREAVWKVICRGWLSRHVPADARVLEIGAGYCEFINNIRAAERVAVDLNPETGRYARPDVAVHEIAAERLAERVRHGYFDVAFMSNFLEHCRSRDHVLAVLSNVAIALKPGGRVLILGPNFRYCYRRYFDYFDHCLPLTERAVVEAIQLAGFDAQIVQPRTLPYTFASRLPSWPWLVRVYLRLPWLWPLFGAQFFIVGRKRSAAACPGSQWRHAA